jgi:two-component system chemotaxis sensor kinase CheA
MSNLSVAIEQSAAAAMSADASDLPSVAALHTQLSSLRDSSAELLADKSAAGPGTDAAHAPGILDAAGKAMRLVEKIVVAEVEDCAAALNQVRGMIAEMQGILGGTAPLPAAAQGGPGPAASPQADGAPAAHGPALTEQVVRAEDVALVRDFAIEGRSHMDAAEARLLALEEEPDNADHINGLFRAFHTIKGVAGFLDLRQIGALSHAAENLLDRARKGIAPLGEAGVDLVLACVDVMRKLIDGAEAAAGSDQPAAPLAGLPEILERLAIAGGAAAKPAIASPSSAPAASLAPAPLPTPAIDAPAANAEAAAPAASPVQAPAIDTPKPAQSAAANNDAFVKVSTERLDSLIDTVGELVIAQAMVAQDVAAGGSNAGASNSAQRLARNMSHLGKITRSLQDLSMAMRMVPIQGVFQKMARLARDVARKAGKEIDFVQVGGDTELDRNVVEAVSDPLVHMVRNAIDHGIEPPELREKAGKPRTGRVQLKAYHQAGNVVIEISDDGRGLSKSRILAKAISCGIIKDGQTLADDEIHRLIFHAGLSTAEKVTDISGRGVGMDVAKKNVEALRGRIDIATEEGKGSLFSIRLPLTLAVIDGRVVRVGKERFIIPITSIEQSLRPQASQIATVQNTGEMCVIRKRLLPLIRLHRLFNIEGAMTDPAQAIVAIVQADQSFACVMVDELLGQQQVVIKSLGEQMGHVAGISGGAILGDGNVSLILDVPGLIAIATKS